MNVNENAWIERHEIMADDIADCQPTEDEIREMLREMWGADASDLLEDDYDSWFESMESA